MSAIVKAQAAEAASKEAFRSYCQQHGWKVAFFEGPTGAPRTGIIGALAYRLSDAGMPTGSTSGSCS